MPRPFTCLLRSSVFLLVLLFAAGCATPGNELCWYHPNKSKPEGDEDLMAARQAADMQVYAEIAQTGTPGFSGFPNELRMASRWREVFAANMESRGYRQIRRSEVPKATTLPIKPTNLSVGFQRGIQPFLYSCEEGYLEVVGLGFSNPSQAPEGLKIGDRIVKIDGNWVTGMTMGEVHRCFLGDAGKKRTIEILTAGGPNRSLSFNLVPDIPLSPAPDKAGIPNGYRFGNPPAAK